MAAHQPSSAVASAGATSAPAAKSHNETPAVLAHSPKDNVAVVVIEGMSADTDAFGVTTENDTTFRVHVCQDIPIGHKVALVDIAAGDTIWKYGEDVGVAKAAIAAGHHVHVHNVKTKRW